MEMITYHPIYFDTDKRFWVHHFTYKNRQNNHWVVDIADGGHRYISLSEYELKLALKSIRDAKAGKLRVERKD